MNPTDKFLNDLQKYWIEQNQKWLEFLGVLGKEPSTQERAAAQGLRLIQGGKKLRRLR